MGMEITSVVLESLSTTYEKNNDENIQISTVLSSINWQEVNTLSTGCEESTELSIGIQSTLWIVM